MYKKKTIKRKIHATSKKKIKQSLNKIKVRKYNKKTKKRHIKNKNRKKRYTIKGGSGGVRESGITVINPLYDNNNNLNLNDNDSDKQSKAQRINTFFDKIHKLNDTGDNFDINIKLNEESDTQSTINITFTLNNNSNQYVNKTYTITLKKSYKPHNNDINSIYKSIKYIIDNKSYSYEIKIERIKERLMDYYTYTYGFNNL